MHSNFQAFNPDTHRINVFAKMCELRKNRDLCDIILIAEVDGTQVPAHRLVLSSCSDYFAAMFTGSFRERNALEIKIGEIDGDVLQQLIDFCYTGSMNFDERTVRRVYIAASLLRLDAVVTACGAYMLSLLNLDNCFDYLRFAEQYHSMKLCNDIELYICQNFGELRQQEQLLQLDYAIVERILKNDELTVDSEEEVFEFMSDWIKCSSKSYDLHFDKLLSNVRLLLLSPAYIAKHVQVYCNSIESKQLVIEALLHHLSVSDISQPIMPRKSRSLLLLLHQSHHQMQLQAYAPNSNCWKNVENRFPRRKLFGAIYLKPRVIIIGGENEVSITNSVLAFNLDTGVSTPLRSMRCMRSGLGVAHINDHIYAIGGFNGSNTMNTVERYNIAENRWQSMQPMFNDRDYLGVAVLDNEIYAVGGCSDRACLDSTECFSPQTNTWRLCAPMLHARAAMGIVASAEHIYVMGGYTSLQQFELINATSSVERYDYRTQRWETLCVLPQPRVGISCAIFNNNVIAVGGEVDGEKSTIVEEFDVKAKMWRELMPLTHCQSYGCVVTVTNQALFNKDYLMLRHAETEEQQGDS